MLLEKNHSNLLKLTILSHFPYSIRTFLMKKYRIRLLFSFLFLILFLFLLSSAAAPTAAAADSAADSAAEVAALEAQGAKIRKNADGNVVVLDARGTEITGAELGNLPEMKDLKDLKLSGAQVTDATLATLAAFQNLTSLALDKTSITDAALVEQVSKLPHLQQLFLAETNITDAGVKALPTLNQLTRLRLAGTKITDEALAELSRAQKDAPKLQSLDASNTAVTSAGVQALKPIATLTDLNVYSTKVDDSACETLGKMTQLVKLNLDSTFLTDAGVAQLVHLPALEFLHVGQTIVTDESAEKIALLKTLKTVHVTRTNITPDATDRLAAALPGCEVVRTLKTPWLNVRDNEKQPVKLIFDTDMGNDIDDALALAIAHHLMDAGRCEILGVTLSKSNVKAAQYCRAFNALYGRPDLPIGLVQNGSATGDGKYLAKILEMKNPDGSAAFPFPADFVPEDSVRLLRKLFADADDFSVVIVQTGFSTNLARLLETPGDDISPLSGKELAAQKVRLVSVMGGAFGKHGDFREYNVAEDAASSQKFFAEWPTEIVVSAWEIGVDMGIPRAVVDRDLAENSMLRQSFLLYCGTGSACAFDLTSVFLAVEPAGELDYFTLTSFGNVRVSDEGRTVFVPSKSGKTRLFVLTPAQKARVTEAMIPWIRSAQNEKEVL